MSEEQHIPDGSYEGRLGGLPLILHFSSSYCDAPNLTIDSPDQGAFAIVCSDVVIAGRQLQFLVPSVNGSWSGALEDDGVTLSGAWTQGAAKPLKLVRNTFVASATPSAVDGIWLGQLTAGGDSLRIQLLIQTDQCGRLFASLDSIDQRKTGLACTHISFEGESLDFDVPTVHGRWTGKLSADRNRLAGRWLQISEFPLDFERQTEATRVQPVSPPRMLPRLPPVPAVELGAQLSRDFGDIVANGWLAPGSAGAVVVGISQDGKRSITVFGAANADSIFEIGSITKTFTGLLLAQMVAQGMVHLNQPISELLPAGSVSPSTAREITLLDLSTHHSGLPRLPSNMQAADPEDPYADYDEEKLLAFLRTYGTGKPEIASFDYSNLGAGLLGYLLANHANMRFDNLLEEQVLRPLGLIDTAINLTGEQHARFIQGCKASGRSSTPWDLNVLAGAGGLRASMTDMLSYLEAFCDPQILRDTTGVSGYTLRSAIEEARKPRVVVNTTLTMCLGWLYQAESDTHCHTGGTGGFTSYATFNRKGRRAVVVLANAAGGRNGSPAELIGRYVVERLEGRAAIWPGTALPMSRQEG